MRAPYLQNNQRFQLFTLHELYAKKIIINKD